jgi:iron complex transport system ATP-binding protein
MLECEDLGLKIRQRWLIQQISLSFKRGTFYGVLGPNGSGKTTLFKTLAGIWKKSSGSVTWKNQDLHQFDRKKLSQTVSFVSQSNTTPFDFTSREIVAMGRYCHGRGKNHEKAIHQALELVEGLSFADKKIWELSQGERQRVFIARSLAAEPEVLLLDEPASNLDIRHQIKLWELLRELANRGKTIIAAHHDLTTVFDLFDEIAVLKEGSLVSFGKPSQIFTPSLVCKVFDVDASKIHLNFNRNLNLSRMYTS